jgi:hypothetical protein
MIMKSRWIEGVMAGHLSDSEIVVDQTLENSPHQVS